MSTSKKADQLLSKDFTAILELCKKLFITWNLDSKKFFSIINHLKKDQIIGLMDGSYEVVKKVKEEVKKLFIFTKFFCTRTGLFVYEDSRMQQIRNANNTPKEYVSTEGLEPVFDLPKNMYDSEIIEKLGGEEKVRANVVDMSQIEQLIENQWGGKAGIMLNNGCVNIFYVLGENDLLFAVDVHWFSDRVKWRVSACELGGRGRWIAGDRVFSNKNLIF